MELFVLQIMVVAVLLLIVARIVPGFRVSGFMPAFWGALLLSIFSFGLTLIF